MGLPNPSTKERFKSSHERVRSFINERPPERNFHADDRDEDMSVYVTSVSYRTVAARSPAWLALAGSLVSFDALKTALCVYVLLTRSAKAYRHVRARGLFETIQDGYKSLLEVSRFFFTFLHVAQAQVFADRGWYSWR